MSKANQKFVQADEAVSPVIGVILMVAITVVLAAVVFVLVSNLSKTSDKAEDAAFGASSPIAGQLHVTMIKMGTNGPYEISLNATSTTADDVFVTLDGQLCDVDTEPNTNRQEFDSLTGFSNVTGSNGEWGAGEVMIFDTNCAGTIVASAIVGSLPLASSSEHRIQVTVRGTLLFEGNVVIR